MRQKSRPAETPSERSSRDIRRATRKQLLGRREDPHRARRPARRDARSPSCAGAKASPRASTTAGRRSSWKPASGGWPATRRGPRPPSEVKDLRRQALELKEVVAEQALELRLLKKSMIADGGDEA